MYILSVDSWKTPGGLQVESLEAPHRLHGLHADCSHTLAGLYPDFSRSIWSVAGLYQESSRSQAGGSTDYVDSWRSLSGCVGECNIQVLCHKGKNKISIIMRILERLDQFKNQGVTVRSKRNRPLMVQIFDQLCIVISFKWWTFKRSCDISKFFVLLHIIFSYKCKNIHEIAKNYTVV